MAESVFAVQYTYTDDVDRVATFRPEHRAHLAELHAEGTLLLSGPLSGGPAALLVVRAESEEAALAALEGDPFLRERVIVDREAREWTVVIGELPGA
ncbi:YciI family protein [Brachybacterium sp. YJGR34]|uniref:YciI family protein n=1 Tax=Brachybacterium sp. YJGR34 TaxID=2059911 RepID=UPI000E0A54D1|nr:YciI family protein [Brachybacterium sp. YJGR34]